MKLGSQTVSFVTSTVTGYDDWGNAITTESETTVAGCRHTPLSAKEAAEAGGNVGSQMWETLAPPEAAAIAAKSTGTLKEGGRTFHIYGGAQPLQDFNRPSYVSILSEIVPGDQSED